MNKVKASLKKKGIRVASRVQDFNDALGKAYENGEITEEELIEVFDAYCQAIIGSDDLIRNSCKVGLETAINCYETFSD